MNKKWVGVALVLPALVVFAVLVWRSIIANLILSFFSWDILTPAKFAGVTNYANMIKDAFFWKYLGNTLFYFFVEGGVIFLLVMLMVYIVGKTSKDVQSRIRILYLIPAAAVFPVACALLWRWIFNPDFGLINGYIQIFHIAPRGPDWLSSKVWAKPAMSIYHICAYMGLWICLGLVIFTNAWNNKKVLKFGILMLLAFILLPTLTDMTSPYMMTGGGPEGATMNLGYYTYNNSFQWFKVGYAATLVIPQLILPILFGGFAWYMVRKYKICCILESKDRHSSGSRGGVGRVILLVVLSVIILLPWLISILWAFSTSLKEPGQIFAFPPAWIPKNITWSNYAIAWTAIGDVPYARFLFNSLYVGIAIALIQMVIIFFGAYSLSVLKPFSNKASNIIFFLIAITIFIPLSTIEITVFVPVKIVGWVDTYKALIIPNIAWTMGFFLMKIYFDGLAPEILQKRKNGWTEGRVFKDVILPKGLPWAIMLGIVSFFQNWHAFGWPLIVTNSMEKKLLPIATASFQGLYTTEWSMLMAKAVIDFVITTAIFLPLFIWCERNVWRKMKLVTGE